MMCNDLCSDTDAASSPLVSLSPQMTDMVKSLLNSSSCPPISTDSGLSPAVVTTTKIVHPPSSSSVSPAVTSPVAVTANGSEKITPPVVKSSSSMTGTKSGSNTSNTSKNKTSSSNKNQGNKVQSSCSSSDLHGIISSGLSSSTTTNSFATITLSPSSSSYVTKELQALEKEQQQIDAEAALLEKKLRMVMEDTGERSDRDSLVKDMHDTQSFA